LHNQLPVFWEHALSARGLCRQAKLALKFIPLQYSPGAIVVDSSLTFDQQRFLRRQIRPRRLPPTPASKAPTIEEF